MKRMALPMDFSDEQTRAPVSLDWEVIVKQLDQWMVDQNIDAILLTSKDPFLSEYVPQVNQCRFAITGFRGSVGESIYWSSRFRSGSRATLKPVTLFVDGRYHLQADQEVRSDRVEVVKIDVEPNIENAWIQRLTQPTNHTGPKRIAIDPERVSYSALESLKRAVSKDNQEIVQVDGATILSLLSLPGWKVNRPIRGLPETATGRRPGEVLNKLAKPQTVFFTAAADEVAFLLNARGYHLPKHSSILAYTFLTGSDFVLFLPAASENCELDLDSNAFRPFQFHLIRNDWKQLHEILAKQSLNSLRFYGPTMNGSLPSLLKEWFPSAILESEVADLIQMRVQKTPEERQSIRTAFLRSSKAIAQTLRFAKKEAKSRKTSEVDLAGYLYEQYREVGAQGLSFSTICGAGPNSAIVHYSSPQSNIYFGSNDIGLIDSGALYAEGFCTDCTRVFSVSTKPEAWQKEIYTVTLKAAISVFLEPVPSVFTGREVDTRIRKIVQDAGYEYAHGTGHGVGIHVHEEGIRFSKLSIYPQAPFACVSVEPGIYLEGRGGVRIENIVFLNPIRTSDGKEAYQFENVVKVGYDWDLIDLHRLTVAEKEYLKAYEQECRELGNSYTECPL